MIFFVKEGNNKYMKRKLLEKKVILWYLKMLIKINKVIIMIKKILKVFNKMGFMVCVICYLVLW